MTFFRTLNRFLTKHNLFANKRFWLLLTLAYGFLFLLIAVLPRSYERGITLIPFTSHYHAIKYWLTGHRNYWAILDIPVNLLLFLPMGYFTYFVFHTHGFRRAAVPSLISCFFFSTGIETLQILLPTRATDIDDLIFNVLGAIVGILAGRKSVISNYRGP